VFVDFRFVVLTAGVRAQDRDRRPAQYGPLVEG